MVGNQAKSRGVVEISIYEGVGVRVNKNLLTLLSAASVDYTVIKSGTQLVDTLSDNY